MANVNRTGRVSKINYEAGTYEVTYFDRGESVTIEVNAISNGEYKMPMVGQFVSVQHSSTDTAAAVSAGTIWNKQNKPKEGFEGLFRKEFSNTPGQAYARHDEKTGVFTLKSGALTINAGGCTITVAYGAVKIVGDLNVIGNLNVGGNITTSGTITAVGDVVGGGISLDNHTHTDNVPGETSGPN